MRQSSSATDNFIRSPALFSAFSASCSATSATWPDLPRSQAMNKPLSESDLVTPKVTTGPIAGSRKIYSVPEAAPDLRVPLREIPLSAGSGEEPVRVDDPSGPYTDNDAATQV